MTSQPEVSRAVVTPPRQDRGGLVSLVVPVLNEQDAYRHLDSKPQTLAAQPHRPAYGTDGDYFSKPSTEDVFEKVYDIMHEADPEAFPKLR